MSSAEETAVMMVDWLEPTMVVSLTALTAVSSEEVSSAVMNAESSEER